jgi:hypothetical protein
MNRLEGGGVMEEVRVCVSDEWGGEEVRTLKGMVRMKPTNILPQQAKTMCPSAATARLASCKGQQEKRAYGSGMMPALNKSESKSPGTVAGRVGNPGALISQSLPSRYVTESPTMG